MLAGWLGALVLVADFLAVVLAAASSAPVALEPVPPAAIALALERVALDPVAFEPVALEPVALEPFAAPFALAAFTSALVWLAACALVAVSAALALAGADLAEGRFAAGALVGEALAAAVSASALAAVVLASALAAVVFASAPTAGRAVADFEDADPVAAFEAGDLAGLAFAALLPADVDLVTAGFLAAADFGAVDFDAGRAVTDAVTAPVAEARAGTAWSTPRARLVARSFATPAPSAMASPDNKTGARQVAAHSRGWQEYGTYGPPTNTPHDAT